MDLRSLGKEPIQPDQPTGSDMRYAPEFEVLQAEIDKLSQPSASGGVDWKRVEKLASEILAGKSKDLLAASYLSVSLVYNRQAEGLALGIQIVRDLVENFWENLYPAKTRMRGRIMAIEWWLEKLEASLKQAEPISVSSDLLKSIQKYLAEIDQFLGQKIEEAPSTRGLQEFVNTHSIQTTEQPASGQAVSTSTGKPTESSPPSPPRTARPELKVEEAGTIASKRDAERGLEQALRKIQEVTGFLWQEDLSSPQAYRLARMAAWAGVDSLPPAANGRTRIPPPAAQAESVLTDLKERGEFESLLKSAEERLPEFIFWIDLNRWVAEALSHLGKRYHEAREAVCQETAFFLQRFPGLEDLLFADGTPFAATETREWLKEASWKGSLAPAGAALNVGPASPSPDAMEEEIQKARQLLREDKILEAVEGIQQKLHSSFSQREKWLWRLVLAQLFMEMKKPRTAQPYLEQLLKDIDGYRLEEWDPSLALRGLRMVWVGLEASTEPGPKEKAREVLHRIARINLAEAIRLGLN
ncbi:MAG: type secretion system and ImpA-related domain protein [Deltaproteobacteria bacterium]|nr:type secretion system and ImpA-related domain protein [Deltaproteobacteria bacterium]